MKMNSNAFIRKANTRDANDIFQIWDQTNQRNYGYPVFSKPPDSLLAIIHNSKNYVYRTNKDGVIGWIAWSDKGENRILEALYVKYEKQRQGIAGMMLEFMINEANGIKTIAAAVLKSGKSAISFYEKQGFKILDNSAMLNGLNKDIIDYYDLKANDTHSMIMFKEPE